MIYKYKLKCFYIKSEVRLKLYPKPQQFTNTLLSIFNMVCFKTYQMHLYIIIPKKI